MGFVDAIGAGFRNYVNFSGRASRSEYWYWVLFVILLSAAAGLVDVAIAGTSGFSVIGALVSLGTFLPSLAVAVRRFHDRDQSGWWILIGLIPLVGIILLIVWFCQRGSVGPNRFGADPLEGQV
jgi:uncharacterized membrane protein YhaH (DUF805 family)